MMKYTYVVHIFKNKNNNENKHFVQHTHTHTHTPNSNNSMAMQMRRGKERNYTWTHQKSSHSVAQTLAAKIFSFPFINMFFEMGFFFVVCRYPKQIKHNRRKTQISCVFSLFQHLFFFLFFLQKMKRKHIVREHAQFFYYLSACTDKCFQFNV